MLASLTAFILAATLLTITPGLDVALVVRTTAVEGPRRAALAAAGIIAGCLCWTVAAAFGLGALLAVSQTAYTALKLAGAAYLVWLGLQMLLRPRASFGLGAGGWSDRGAFARGALSNLLNPKVGIFYVSFLPQFVPAGVQPARYMLMLGLIHALISIAWFAVLIGAGRRVVGALRRPGILAWLDRITGGLFAAFGLGLAWEGARAA